MYIHKILENLKCVQGYENNGKSACEYFQHMFTGENNTINEENFECIPRMVNHEQNDTNPTMM